MAKLLNYNFEWVLPGHGDIHHDTVENMRYHLAVLPGLDENASLMLESGVRPRWLRWPFR